MGIKPQAQEEKSKLIQANKTLEMRDRDLTAAIRRCHIELAKKRKSLSEIEATKDAVEAAWNKYNHVTASYCARAGENLSTHPHRCFGYFEEEGQPEEARRALYEWKVLTDMMEQVVDKAEEYLESATKKDSQDELCEDEDGGNELDAEVEVQRWMEQVSARNKVNEVAPEVNDVNKVNDESTVNKDDGMACSNKKVEPEVSNVNKVNEVNVSEVNVNAEEVKFDVKVEVFGMKEVKNLKDDNKVEVFDAEVNNGKV